MRLSGCLVVWLFGCLVTMPVGGLPPVTFDCVPFPCSTVYERSYGSALSYFSIDNAFPEMTDTLSDSTAYVRLILNSKNPNVRNPPFLLMAENMFASPVVQYCSRQSADEDLDRQQAAESPEDPEGCAVSAQIVSARLHVPALLSIP